LVTIGPETSEISRRKKSKRIETSAVKYNGRRPASWRAAINSVRILLDNLCNISAYSGVLTIFEVDEIDLCSIGVSQHGVCGVFEEEFEFLVISFLDSVVNNFQLPLNAAHSCQCVYC